MRQLISPAGVKSRGGIIMADEIKHEQVDEEATNIDESTPTDESLKTDEPKGVDSKHIPYDRFKAKVDEANALKEKLAEFENAQAEAERKKLEEQNRSEERRVGKECRYQGEASHERKRAVARRKGSR